MAMQRRNPGATVALLQRANSQLKGEKIQKPTDELDDYLSSLTQKTSQQKKSVNFEDLGESISISSDIEDAPVQPKPVPVSSAGSKFLKKKTPSTEDQNDSPSANKFLKKPQFASASPVLAQSTQARKYGAQLTTGSGGRLGGQPGGRQQTQGSSALDKFSAITGKMQQRAATRKTFTLESDSDESFMAKTPADPASASVTTESVKIGRDGGKFMKKATPAAQSEPPLTSVNKQSPSPTRKAQITATASIPAKQQNTGQKKASPYALKSSMRHATDVVLTSEEESLAEFVGGLPSSSGDSFERRRPQTNRHAARHSPSPPPSRHSRRPATPPSRSGRPTSGGKSRSPSPTKPLIRRSPSPHAVSPSPSPNLRRRSPSPKLLRSYSDDSNVADSIKSEIAEDFDIGVNTMSTSTPRVKKKVVIMDLDDLGPADDDPIPEVTELKHSESSYRDSVRKPERESKGKKSSFKKDCKDRSKGTESPFKASSAERDDSPFKSSSAKKEKSLFKTTDQADSPFKSSSGKSKSPFKAKDKANDSPFKANNKENVSPFKAKAVEEESPFKAKSKDSPFKSSPGGSVFKAADKTTSPFKAKSSSKYDSDQDKSVSRTVSTKSRKKKKNKKDKPAKSKGKKKEGSDIFSSFGIQTVEDLLGSSVKVSEYESITDDVDNRSDVSEEIRTERRSAYSYSQKFDDSVTEIATEVNGTKQSGPSYTEDFDSISERIGFASDTGKSSASEVPTRYSDDETQADDTVLSESDTETIDGSSYTETNTYTETYSKRYDDSYASYSEDFTKSLVPTSRSDMTPAPPRGKAHLGIQTTVDGIQYSWDAMGSGLSFAGRPYGLSFVDPTPIATHVVSADALEAMTAYSPAMLALQDMLRSQLELTQDFLESQKRMYQQFAANVEPKFHYTTLEDTKKYIKKNKKKKLTFKEALKLVDQEMR